MSFLLGTAATTLCFSAQRSPLDTATIFTCIVNECIRMWFQSASAVAWPSKKQHNFCNHHYLDVLTDNATHKVDLLPSMLPIPFGINNIMKWAITESTIAVLDTNYQAVPSGNGVSLSTRPHGSPNLSTAWSQNNWRQPSFTQAHQWQVLVHNPTLQGLWHW